MFRHHLLLAGRAFARTPFHTAARIAVLALGLVCFFSADLFVTSLQSFERGFPNADRIYVVYQSSRSPTTGYSAPLAAQTAIPVAEQLALEAPELSAVARFLLDGVAVSVDGGAATFRRVAYVDPQWPDIFQLKVIAGSVDKVLARQRTVILTAQTAKELFGTTSIVGRVLGLTARAKHVDVTVAAVVDDVAPPSHLANGPYSVGFEILCSWDVFEAAFPEMPQTSWVFPSVRTYVLLPDGKTLDAAALNARLRAFGERKLPEADAQVHFEARPVSQLVKDDLQKRLQGYGVGDWLPIDATSALLWLSAAILGVACLNFANLAAAQAVARTREIGIRKSLGATTLGILSQELLQTGVAVLIASVVAFSAVGALSPLLEDPWPALLALPISTIGFWLFVGAILIAVTFAAGLYPAITLARGDASSSLRLGAKNAGSRFVRAVLVGAQFGAAALLGIAVLIAHVQGTVAREATVGRLHDPYVVLAERLRAGNGVDFDMVANELGKGRGIKGVTAQSSYPWQNLAPQQQLARSPAEGAAVVLADRQYVSYDYFAVMDTPLLAGRSFSRDRVDDSVPLSPQDAQRRTSPPRVVIDRRAAKALGWATPEAAVGQIVYGPRKPIEIIGVVESSPLALRNRGNNAVVYFLSPALARNTLVRLDSAQVPAALKHIDEVWKRLGPDSHVLRSFLDETFDRAYEAFDTTARVVAGLAIFASVIAAIGLLGMASFMTALRRREIALRKSQGATTGSILRLLLWDFSKPVLVANLVIWPLAYWGARAYLDLFIDRMAITPLPFLAVLAVTLVLAWLVVSTRVLRAARLRPTDALRCE